MGKGIAYQIRASRTEAGLSQAELAAATAMKQNNICRLESPDYGKYSLASLKRIADALDIALVVRFVPFSQYVDWLSGTPFLDRGINPSALAVPSFQTEEDECVFERNFAYWPHTQGGKTIPQEEVWEKFDQGKVGVRTLQIENSRYVEDYQRRERAS